MSKQLASETCPVCKGEGSLRCTIHDDHQFECPECGGVGVVPAAGDLAQWREKAERMVHELASAIIDPPKPLDLGYLMIGGLDMIRNQLAAMPAQDPNAELLEALKRCLLFISNPESFESEYGAPEFPESSMSIEVWLDDLLLGPARDAIAQAEKGAAG